MGAPPSGTWFGACTRATNNPDPRQVAEIITTRLAGISYGRLPIAIEPIVVPLSAYRELLDATSQLLRLHHQAVVHLGPDRSSRMAAIKADPADFPRFTSNEPFEFHHAADMARADVIIGTDGPQFIELNVGGGANGMIQFELLRRIWKEVRLQTGEPALTGTDPFAALAHLIQRSREELGTKARALLIGSLDDPGLSSIYFDTQVRLLAEHGVSAQFVPLSQIHDQIPEDGSPEGSLGVVQFHEREANSLGWDVSPLSTAMHRGLVGIPSQTARLLDSKKILALLSEGLPWMSREDHALVARFVPWSRVVSDRRVKWRGKTHGLARLLTDRQESFVLKGSAGLSSQEVLFGAAESPRAWADLVDAAIASEYYIVQEVVTAVRHPVQVMFDNDGPTETVSANPVISPFCVGGTTTGCLFRFDHQECLGPVSRSSGALIGCLLGSP